MKSPEVYALIKSELAPWFKASGFTRTKNLLSWSRPHGNAHIVVWCQISQDGWDSYAGSKFFVEFQRSTEPIVGASPARSERLAEFLSLEEREQVRSLQNWVISSLQFPPQDHPNLHISPEITKWYLAEFKQVTEPYPERHDIWFRYSSPEHVVRWADFIVRKLPECVSAIEAWGSLPEN